MNLKDKVVLITGSSSGIGKNLAIRFAKEGSKIIVNYHINEKGAEETLAEIKEFGAQGIIVQADVTKPEDIKRMFDTTIDEYKSIDILINNAGIGTDKVEYLEAEYKDFKEMVDTNLIGPMICTQHAIKIMRKQGGGKILFTSSIRGVEYGGRAPVYAATKAALNSFTKTIAKQCAPEILVNAVAPGCVKTRTYDKLSQERIDALLNMQYLKRFLTPEEIADAFIFLAKNDAMTGQVIYVDGGFTLK